MAQPYETSLSKLTEHDWRILSARNMRGIDWMVHKIGKRHWQITPSAFAAFPLFKTKAAAYDAADNLMLAESRNRLHLRMTAEGYSWNGERYVQAA